MNYNLDKKYGPEWAILFSVASMLKDDKIIEDILSSYQIDWGKLLTQAMNHKIAPMLCWKFIRSETLFNLLPPFTNQYFKMIYDVNRLKVQIFKKEAIRITEIMKQRNIPCVLTKGILLDNELYSNEGYRFLSDIDFIASANDKQTICATLNDIGYTAGTINWRTHEIINWKSNDIEHYEKDGYYWDNTKISEHVKLIDEMAINFISLGFCTELSWETAGFYVSPDEALTSRITADIGLNDAGVPSLNPVYHFIYIILHLYKHAWVTDTAKWNNDVNLVKFADVYHFYQKHKKILNDELLETIELYDIMQPITWTLYHVDDCFGSNTLQELGLVNFLDRDKINCSLDKNGNLIYFEGNMMDRLESTNRCNLIKN